MVTTTKDQIIPIPISTEFAEGTLSRAPLVTLSMFRNPLGDSHTGRFRLACRPAERVTGPSSSSCTAFQLPQKTSFVRGTTS